jgi:hypothetical protein
MRLLYALWEGDGPREAVPLNDVIEQIYSGKVKPQEPTRALKELCKRTQMSLDAEGVPIFLERINETLRLSPVGTK